MDKSKKKDILIKTDKEIALENEHDIVSRLGENFHWEAESPSDAIEIGIEDQMDDRIVSVDVKDGKLLLHGNTATAGGPDDHDVTITALTTEDWKRVNSFVDYIESQKEEKARANKSAKEQNIHEDDNSQTDVAGLAKKYIESGMDPKEAEKKAKEDLNNDTEERADEARKAADAQAQAETEKRTEAERKAKEEEEAREKAKKEESNRDNVVTPALAMALLALGIGNQNPGNVILVKDGDTVHAYATHDVDILQKVNPDLELEKIPTRKKLSDGTFRSNFIKSVTIPYDSYGSYMEKIVATGNPVILVDGNNDMEVLLSSESKEYGKKSPRRTEDDKPHVDYRELLLDSALERSVDNDGIWVNQGNRPAPRYIGGIGRVSPFYSLMMSLDTEHRGYRTGVYTSFEKAKESKAPVRKVKEGTEHEPALRLRWDTWSSYKNIYNGDINISPEDYKALSEDKKRNYRGVKTESDMPIFNVDQTLMSRSSATKDKYKKYADSYVSRVGNDADFIKAIKNVQKQHPGVAIFAEMPNSYMLIGDDAVNIAKAFDINPVKQSVGGETIDTLNLPKDEMKNYIPFLNDKGIKFALAKNAWQQKSAGISTRNADFMKSWEEKLPVIAKNARIKIVRDIDHTGVSYNPSEDAIHVGLMPDKILSSEDYNERSSQIIRSVADALGSFKRLDRKGFVPGYTDDADKNKIESFVSEGVAAYYLTKQGLSARLSEDSQRQVPFWRIAFKNSPKLMEHLSENIKNTVEVADKFTKGEKVNYNVYRSSHPANATGRKPVSNNVVRALGKEPVYTSSVKRFAVIRDAENSHAYVILPNVVPLDKDVEKPGMSKERIYYALSKEGYQDITFHHSSGKGALRLPDDGFKEGLTASVTSLKQYELVNEEKFDTEKHLHKNDLSKVERVSHILKDDGKYDLFVKPEKGDYFTVSATASDMKAYWDALGIINNNEKQTKIHYTPSQIDSARDQIKEIGLKYINLAKKNPEIKGDTLTPKYDKDIDLSRISNAQIFRDPYKPKLKKFCASIDGKPQPEIHIRRNFYDRMFLLVGGKYKNFNKAENKIIEEYKTKLAAHFFGEALSKSVTNGQSEERAQSQPAAQQQSAEHEKVDPSKEVKAYHIGR